MAQFNGKWEIECSENFSEYMHAIGVSEEKQTEAQKFLGDSSKLTYEISSSGNDWVFKISTAAGEREVKFSLGSEIDSSTLDGRAIKTVFTLDGEALMEKQTGTGFETNNKRTVSGNTMTMVRGTTVAGLVGLTMDAIFVTILLAKSGEGLIEEL